jgi:hypothetical protein
MIFPAQTGMIAPGATDTGLRRLRATPRTNLSDQGIAFLKCAFAPPDFQASSVAGIPDDYRGPSLTRKHRYVASQSFAASDYYFLLLPTPGVAFWSAVVTSGSPILGSTVWQPTLYTDSASMFPDTATTTSVVTKFRFVSNHFELIPTVNQMTWSGSIQAWKIPVTLIVRQSVDVSKGYYAVEGLDGTNTALPNQYTGSFFGGIYTACYNAAGTFEFTQIQENCSSVPAAIVSGTDFGQLNANPFTGFDNNFESMVIKVSGVSATETAIIKTWACVEYQASPLNALYEFSNLSPCDPMAIELYRSIINGLPIGVPFEDNESFWNRVLQIVNQLTGLGSALPGPYGMASRGLNMITSAGLMWSR